MPKSSPEYPSGVPPSSVLVDIDERLQERLGHHHAAQRLSIEDGHEFQKLAQGLNFFPAVHSLVRNCLRAVGLYRRGYRNAADVGLRTNDIITGSIPSGFDGYRILHLSDLHVDLSGPAIERVVELVTGLDHDICVLTGDYRGQTFGPFDAALDGVERIRRKLTRPIYGVLGNYDTARMVPRLEDMGIRMLMNECDVIERNGDRIYLAGVDDAHFFRLDNIGIASEAIPDDAFSILLSHTPEIYRQAAHAGFNVLLAGHTHGGQLCLRSAGPLPTPYKLGAMKRSDPYGC